MEYDIKEFEKFFDSNSDASKSLSETQKALLEVIARNAENRKGVFTVTVTSLFVKSQNPDQDTRLHQANMPGGYSGRTVDTRIVTPTLKKFDFPSMAESGWLTRSLEQNAPFNADFPGKVNPKELKLAFLEVLRGSNENELNNSEALAFLISRVRVEHVKPRLEAASFESDSKISPVMAMTLLRDHWFTKYKGSGASRLPVLAVFCCLKNLVHDGNSAGFSSMVELENHTSPDLRSKALGDIEVLNDNGHISKAFEVKFGKSIGVSEIYEIGKKIRGKNVDTYVALTDQQNDLDREKLDEAILSVEKISGTRLVVQDTFSFLETSILYLPSIEKFILDYLNLVKLDKSLKYGHLSRLLELLTEFTDLEPSKIHKKE